MSTLRVDNFGPSAGGTTYSACGIAKAWVRWNPDTNTIVSDSSVSSVTDVSTGNLTVNVTNAFTSVDNTAPSGSASDGNDNSSWSMIAPDFAASSTTSLYFRTLATSDGANDIAFPSIIIHGDLA